ncbi:MAG TPA: hypothetical protein VNA30_08155 [Mycobacteriales bacterium]|nr:hypothetical protein [Mycobacteriales bacterium]
MTTQVRRATALALAAAVAFVVPAGAHAPRDERPGAPRMDLEVLVTPAVTGQVTPGGLDAVVAVDGFGNRFALARKEEVQTLVGVDQRARTVVRTSAWQWYSPDDGLTWENFETLPRGAETLLPQGVTRDIAAAGPLTWIAEGTPAGIVLTTITATYRGRFTPGTPALLAGAMGPGSRVSVAGAGPTVVVVAGAAAGGSQVHISKDGGASFGSPMVMAGTACDATVDPRRPAVAAVACLDGETVTLHTSRDGGKTFTARPLGSRDVRGGDTAEPSVDTAPDGTIYVLSGLRMWRLAARGPVRVQDLQTVKGAHRASVLSVSRLGRVGAAAYRLTEAGTWNIVVTIFSAGKAPVWSDFAFHDPATPRGAAAPPSGRLSVDFDERARIQLMWTSTFLQETTLQRPLLRNVWAIRSTST